MEEVFRQFIEEERHRDRTVLLSSHILSEVEALCDRISIIRRGKVVETGTLAELRHLTRTSIQAELVSAPNGIAQLPGVHGLEIDGNKVRCEVDTALLEGLMKQLAAGGIKSLVAQPPTLEELFLRHYEDDASAAADAVEREAAAR
jgi:ABC-2 type transport system ATP-binding protein